MHLTKTQTNQNELILFENIAYEEFELYAYQVVERMELEIVQKVDAIGEMLWIVRYQEDELFLSWDDWFFEVSLLSRGEDSVVVEIYDRYKDIKT